MRVITGSARGRRLLTLEGMDVRPTVSKVKEGIFSAIQFDIEGRKILDLFAGSGQLGIEALSRGAQLCVFVDNSRNSLDIVKKNLSTCELEKNARVILSDYTSFLAGKTEKFDIAFIDPPYRKGIIDEVMKLLPERMSEAGVVLCEHPVDEKLKEQYGDFVCKKVYKYGKVNVSLYRRDDR
ncbi:MAG: 16S rRNA (guanine(966)-N(2))-methyltransferase RsmD [Clostridia bacterium]|nr:16S rRNA (guanine(966)-N(2))-methyltransferase RsmD [Clostridia bacterium]